MTAWHTRAVAEIDRVGVPDPRCRRDRPRRGARPRDDRWQPDKRRAPVAVAPAASVHVEPSAELDAIERGVAITGGRVA